MKEIITLLVLTTTISCVGQHVSDFKAHRISQSASFDVNGKLTEVFPLFGPVREAEWAPGWNPEIIYSDAKEVEVHMIFKTLGHHKEEPWYTWVVSQFNSENYFIEYTVSTNERIWFIRVQCEQLNEKTSATVTYTYTSLTELGEELNKKARKEMFSQNLKDWQRAINHYLETGEKISH